MRIAPGISRGAAGSSTPASPAFRHEPDRYAVGEHRSARSWSIGIMDVMPIEMSRRDFDELVSDALDLIPAEFTKAMDNVVVLVEDRHPTRSLYGLYHGVALTARTSNYSGTVPDTIHIYREPILRYAHSEQEAKEQVAKTVIHEVAHHFGIDDERLDELGWA